MTILAQRNDIYRADCAFLELDPDTGRSLNTERSYSIFYLAPPESSPSDIAADAHRWADNRIRNLPEIFGPLLCIKIYVLNPKAITSTGQYYPPTSFPFYEWKCDHGKRIPIRHQTIQEALET